MSQVFWQAKIWGLLHDPALKALHNNRGRGGESDWQSLAVMSEWLELLQNSREEAADEVERLTPKKSTKKPLKWIADSDLITSASDRSAIGSLNSTIDYEENGLEISHLLSGVKIPDWKLPDAAHRDLIKSGDRTEYIKSQEQRPFPDWLRKETDPKKVFWWLWRCLPEAACQAFDDPSLLLMPAETRIPDGSIWSHTSMTAALCGALAGYDLTSQEITERWSQDKPLSRAYLTAFSFTPVQELIKASRKMRDFWASSWVLHYLSAKVCWDLAQIYGPDSFVYPSLFQQPLIDYWLWEKWPEFQELVDRPRGEKLLTAGFPNVLIMMLPKDRVAAAMQTAQQSLKEEWRRLGREVFKLPNLDWGIPWVRKHHEDWPNPRLLNAGWLIDDYEPASDLTHKEQIDARNQQLKYLKEHISKWFSAGNNLTDWYVLAAGDGDSMSEWLKGEFLEPYREYVPQTLQEKCAHSGQEAEGVAEKFNEFLTRKKRMGPATHSALSHALLDFSNQLVPYLTEQRYAGRLIYSGGDDVLAYTNLWEWDQWLWDVRQCFKGSQDPHGEFDHTGDYWRWKKEEKGAPLENVSARPLFTMGRNASISFGIVIAHHSVPLAIALENLWEAEDEAKEHIYLKDGEKQKKDAVQVQVLYGNGNILKATSKFEVFNQWRKLIDFQQQHPEIDPALFEQAAEVWSQHPVPIPAVIPNWTQAFCSRRDALSNNPQLQEQFHNHLANLLSDLWLTAQHYADEREMGQERDRQIQSWLKLAAFVLRKREIKLPN